MCSFDAELAMEHNLAAVRENDKEVEAVQAQEENKRTSSLLNENSHSTNQKLYFRLLLLLPRCFHCCCCCCSEEKKEQSPFSGQVQSEDELFASPAVAASPFQSAHGRAF